MTRLSVLTPTVLVQTSSAQVTGNCAATADQVQNLNKEQTPKVNWSVGVGSAGVMASWSERLRPYSDLHDSITPLRFYGDESDRAGLNRNWQAINDHILGRVRS